MEWEPVRPAALRETLARFVGPWWVAGGWALDLFLGRETRRHEDLDVAVLRRDQQALRRALPGWDLSYATPAHALEPWDGRPLELPVHAVWARRSRDEAAPWTCEFLLNECDGETWRYRRDLRVTQALSELGCERDGLPVLRPEVVLLYKSTERSPRSEADFEAVAPELPADARAWLREAVTLCVPGHPWLERL